MGKDDLFESVKPKRLSDSAVDQILNLVNTGQLTPGSRMPPERELITRLGVSRTSLREAIRILETLGVLRVVPGRGTWVRDDYQRPSLGDTLAWLPNHEHDVLQLFEVRETIELLAPLPNVYAEISFQPPAVIRRLVKAFGPDRVIYGSDWPWGSRRTALASVRAACRGDALLERAILGGNASALFGIPAA